jgi:hypothetical protein
VPFRPRATGKRCVNEWECIFSSCLCMHVYVQVCNEFRNNIVWSLRYLYSYTDHNRLRKKTLGLSKNCTEQG